MRSLLVGAAALVLTTLGPAVAKDLESAAPMDQWSGGYAGFHVGYGQGHRSGCFNVGFEVFGFPLLSADPIQSCNDETNGTFAYNQSGGLVGLQTGYNWQAAENFLLGVEVSASATGITGRLDGPMGGDGTWNSLLMGTVKAGITNDRWLLYAEGGFAAATVGFVGDLGCNFSVTHGGPVAGAGVSYKLSDRVSIDLKYDHVWAGPKLIVHRLTACAGRDQYRRRALAAPHEGSLDIVKLGLNFRLGY